MPTYEYHCAQCDRTFDVVQSFHDDPLTECPTCGQPVRKVFGNVGIVFKGSGFYKTDSRSSKRTTTSEGTESPSPSPSSTTPAESRSGTDTGPSKESAAPSAPSSSNGSTDNKPTKSTEPKTRPSQPAS